MLIAVSSLVLLTACKQETKKSATAEQIKQEIVKNNSLNKSTIYYFHGNKRCQTCQKIEAYTQEVFDNEFRDTLDMKLINLDAPENRHFIEKYNLYSRSVVLAKAENGQEVDFRNLDKVWVKAGDKQDFQNYITTEVKSFLFN